MTDSPDDFNDDHDENDAALADLIGELDRAEAAREKVFQEDPLGATMFGEAYRHGDDADAARVDEWWARRGL